jgi:tRNA(Ile)-lysidine synthase
MHLGACTLKTHDTRNKRVLALIVEHGLRAESAQEAADVAARLCAMGIETEILPWTHDAVTSRVHVRARDARYRLLVEACKRRGIAKLFLAHHADDQAETVLMRFAKGSGIDGLAGMKDITDFEGIRLIRPFLTLRKDNLVALCEANNIVYVTDPSNEADKYARGRLRKVMPLLADEGLTVERLVDLSDRAREAKDALDHYAFSFLRQHVLVKEGCSFLLDVGSLRGEPRAVGLRVVAMILMFFSGDSYPPERKPLLDFYRWLVDQDEDGARTLGGCLLQKGEVCDKATAMREPSAATESLAIAPNETLVWDNRWFVTYAGHEKGLEVRALGIQTQDVLDAYYPGLRNLVPQGRVRATLPALWKNHNLVAIPSFHKQDQRVATASVASPFWTQI